MSPDRPERTRTSVASNARLGTGLASLLTYAALNVYLCHVALETSSWRSYDPAFNGPIMDVVVIVSHSAWFRCGVMPFATWLACTATLWHPDGRVGAAVLSALLTVFTFVGSFYIAAAMWGS
jgi:hypothetical protein